ncbi:nuclear transport factor 2 family protein [Lysobacter sp. 1R34A]|uniref:nuclear transport factor 2 family protein n=1 Tax=Lysobacter sp. 1R34A TaxID=3445786 RepID=UPI003EEF4CE9
MNNANRRDDGNELRRTPGFATPWRRLALGAVLALLATACGRDPPEQRLRESVAQLQAAIEQRDAPALQEWLADDFVGPEGLDREGARRLAVGSFLRYRQLGVTIGPLDVAMRPEHATVRFTAALTGGSGQPLPEAARVYEVETGWREQDGDWRMTSARWTAKL